MPKMLDAARRRRAQKSSRHLISVVLPAPLTPTRPKNSPARDVEVDAAQHRRPCRSACARPLDARATGFAMERCGVAAIVCTHDIGARRRGPRRRRLLRPLPLAFEPLCCRHPPALVCHARGFRRAPFRAHPGHRTTWSRSRTSTFAYDGAPGPRRHRACAIPRGKVVAIMGGQRLRQDHAAAPDRRRAASRPSGDVRVDRPVGQHELDHDELYALRRRMGMLFQFGALFTDMSVFDNVAFQMREHTDLPEAMIRDLVLMKLHAVGLRGAHALMPARALRRHGAARGAGARDRARSDADHVRRAVRRPRPDLAGA